MPVPPLVDERLFRVAQEQLEENGPALVWVGAGLDTSYRDLPAVQSVVMPITVRPLANEARAIALRTIVTTDALGRMGTALGENAFAATDRSRLSFWKPQCGVRSATF